MSSTRYAAPGTDPDAHPESRLASRKVRGLSIGTNTIARIARVLPQAERDSMLWLQAYARLRDLTPDALSTEIDMDWAEIRRALTDPETDRTRFVRQVTAARAEFERWLDTERAPHEQDARGYRLRGRFDEAHRKIADTKVRRKIRNAIRLATGPEASIVEIIGKHRCGKSISARNEFLRNLHRAAWVHVPGDGTERDFHRALAEGLGCSYGTSEKACQLTPKIEACVGPNRINVIFLDEGHRLWPADIRKRPSRVDYLRDLWEIHGCSIVIVATDQYSDAVAMAMDSSDRWAPGQWVGRAHQFLLSETMSREDLLAIARCLAPEACDAIADQLVLGALNSCGYAGHMARTVERARYMHDDCVLVLANVISAQRALERDDRAALMARGKKMRAN